MLDVTVLALLGLLPAASGFALPDGTGRLPAMGWNSWNAYHCDVDEDKVMTAANAMVSKGFLKAGYNYVNVDDCWSVKSGRDNTTHQIVPDYTKFPDGISGLATKLHNMGMKSGIYSSAGTETCAGYPASLGYEAVDAETFAAWGIDYLKYDNCNVPSYWADACYACTAQGTATNGSCAGSSSTDLCHTTWPVDGMNYAETYTGLRYRIMGEALQAQNRTILYSLCEWGNAEVWTWGNATAQSWRMSGDISPNWDSVIGIINQNSFLSNYGGFGGHNDPDMLEIGNGGLSDAESRTHFGMWALMKAPLLIGTDITNLSQADMNIMLAKRLIAFNQDPDYGAPAAPYKWGLNPDWTYNSTNPAAYWSGASSKGVMVALLNSLDTTQQMVIDFGEVPQLNGQNPYRVINAWTGQNMGCKQGSVNAAVQSHDTAIYLFEDSCVGLENAAMGSDVTGNGTSVAGAGS